jgi:hypothetical protein
VTTHPETPDSPNNTGTTGGSNSGEHEAPQLRPVRDGDRPAVRRPKLWAADTLMDTVFPPPKWAVPGIICEGVSLVCGPPKVGKSWLLLALALAVAGGGKAFGAVPVRPGPVLYLALEDTPRRLKSRMGRLLGDDPAPAGLSLATDWPTLPAGGDLAIAAWLDANPTARLVVIDVFAKMRGPSAPGSSAYDADYAAVGRAKRIADNYAVAVVLVHHVRKAGSDDFLAEVSGTNGIAGAADATLVLKRARGQHDGVLHVTGRDVEEAEIAMRQDADTKHWHKLDGVPDDYALGETRAAILRYVREHPGVTPKEITGGTSLGYDTVRKTCARMATDGQLSADASSRYSAPTAGAVPGVPSVPAPKIPGLTCEDTWDTPGRDLSQHDEEETR